MSLEHTWEPNWDPFFNCLLIAVLRSDKKICSF